MTRIFDENGDAIPVTVVQAGPCTVMQVRNKERDGYEAVQLGFGDVKPHRATMPKIGHALAAGTTPKRYLREVRLTEPTSLGQGDVVTVELFSQNNIRYVDVIGVSKGRGFAGVMKRYHFGGMPNSHGTERKHRSPGSIGSHGNERGGTGGPKKGKRMGGHLGDARITVKSQRLIQVDVERNLLLVEGGIPGPNGGCVLIRKAKTRS